MRKFLSIAIILSLLNLVACKPTHSTSIKSPSGEITLQFSIDDLGQPQYEVSFKNSNIIGLSHLGFEAANELNLATGFKLIDTHTTQINEEWSAPWGENKQHSNHYNSLAVDLINKTGTQLTLFFRAYDEGIAFRYQYHIEGVTEVILLDEYTAFNFVPKEATTWSIPGDFESYEHLYRTLPLSQLNDANTPVSIKFDHIGYAALHEAALTNFPEMIIKATQPNQFKAELAPLPDGTKALLPNNFKTPWRSLHLVDRAIDLIGSSLILNLNEPSVIEDTSWIKPMKYIGVWWGMHLGIESWSMHDRHGATTEKALAYIDFAHKNNIDAVLFEGWNEGWDTWGTDQKFDYTTPYADFDIDRITRYAKERNIAVIGHHETGGNIPHYEAELDDAFAWYKEKGIVDVKTGYAGGFKGGYRHHSQYGVKHYRKVVEKAAALNMTINAHEPIKDTGIRRTYPNSMTREGSRGMEWNAWSTGNPPEHQTILPFTVNVAGPIDYTPGIFDILYENTRNLPERKKWNDQDQGNSRVHTTLAKQMALWVVIYSPMQMAADLISNYEGHPAFQFFRDFDADCDATYPLAGEPGQYVAIARKAKENYYLGAITNEEPRNLTVALDFLEKGKTYEATIYADAEDADWINNPTAYKISKQEVTTTSQLDLNLAAGGGVAITILPIESE